MNSEKETPKKNFNSFLTLFFILSSFFVILYSLFFIRYSLFSLQKPSPQILSVHDTQLSAFIGGEEAKLSPFITPSPPVYLKYSLFGYTSSYATVNLEGIDLSQQTKADETGYFEFINFLAPNNIKEFCLNNIDTENLASPPLCVAAPQENTSQKYGPYLLPPTIRIEKGESNVNETNQVVGKTIPGTNVLINAFSDQTSTSQFSFIKKAYANNKATIKVKASADGSYTTNLNLSDTGKIRLFSQSTYLNQKTPKSNTLSISILSFWIALFLNLYNLLLKLLNPNNIILLQLLILFFLLWKKKQAFISKNKRQLMILDKHYLLVENTKQIIKKIT